MESIENENAQRTDAFIRCKPASFGPRITDTLGLKGSLAPINQFQSNLSDTLALKFDDNLGCPDELHPLAHYVPNPPKRWIALVQRGGCPFIDKVRESQRLGAEGVIVGDWGSREDDDGGFFGLKRGLINMWGPGETGDIKVSPFLLLPGL